MLGSTFRNSLRHLVSKDSKPLILFVRLFGAGLFFLASIFITNNFSIQLVSDFEFANSLLLLSGSLVILGTDISILQIAGRLKSQGRFHELRAIFLKVIGLIFGMSFLILFFFYLLSFTTFYTYLNITVTQILIYKVLGTATFYGCLVFTAEAFRPLSGSLVTELYHGILKYALFFVGIFVIYNYKLYNFLIDIYLLSFIVVSIGIVIHFLIASSDLENSTTYTNSDILKISFPMTISSLSFFILLTADVIILKILGTDAAVSIYAQPLKIIAVVIRIKVTLETSYSSDIATLYFSEKWNTLRNTVRKVNRWIAVFCIPIILFFVVFARQVLSIFGDKYEAGVYAFYILLGGVFINVVAGCTGSYMNMTGKQKALRNILFVAALINVLLNILLIPHYGMYGAAFASFVAVLFWNFSAVVYIWKKDKILMLLS